MNAAHNPAQSIAFDGDRRIACGELREVARAAKLALDGHGEASILIFNAETSQPVEIDFRGSLEDVLGRLPAIPPASTNGPMPDAAAPRRPGRPKLGVVAREITLLPRHWDWLAGQRGGASVAIRRLVDEARRANESNDRARAAQEAAYRFMSAMAGNRPHYEDAIRALFAGDTEAFERMIAGWPADIRGHARHLADKAFKNAPSRDPAPVDPAAAAS